MTVLAFSNDPHLLASRHESRKSVVLLPILLLHLLGLYFIFRTEIFPVPNPKTTAIFLQFLPLPADKPIQEKPIAKSSSVDRPSAKPTTQPPPISKPTQAVLVENNTSQANEIRDPSVDPFNTMPTKPDKQAPRLTESERYRLDAGKAWKQIESELPVKRWLSIKKELNTMERFAQNLLEGAPAREIQTKEEMRPDGSRMTRVKTPRGEFCVVAPQPGRTYDVRGPEHRVMSCPIYF